MKITDLITPVGCPWERRRFGPRHDCGYVIAMLPGPLHNLFSYGAGSNIDFEAELQQLTGCRAVVFDHTVDAIYIPGIACVRAKGTSASIARHVATIRNPRFDAGMLLKMDIEGDEWEIFENALPTLLQFQQICVEVHNLTVRPFADMARQIEPVLREFRVVHAHGNNYGRVQDGVPDTLELTLVRKDMFPSEPVARKEPFPDDGLDYPNNTKLPDIKLDWWLPAPPVLKSDERPKRRK